MTETRNLEQILALPAGPELDALVAERVPDVPMQRVTGLGVTAGTRVPLLYSSSISAAFMVLDALEARGWRAHIHREVDAAVDWPRGSTQLGWRVRLEDEHDYVSAWAPGGREALPLAICRAALLAMESEHA